jgi:hypothetical protein
LDGSCRERGEFGIVEYGSTLPRCTDMVDYDYNGECVDSMIFSPGTGAEEGELESL